MFGQSTAPEGLGGGERTRILNVMNRAQRSGMAGNPAAVNSLRDVTGPLKKRPQSEVSGYSESQGPPAVGAGHPLSALSAPAVEQPEDPVRRYNRNAAIEGILSSPDMMDTVTRLKLRNHFQGRPDDGIGTEALEIVKQMHGIS